MNTHILISIKEIEERKQKEIDKIQKLWKRKHRTEEEEFVYVGDNSDWGYSANVKKWDDLLHLSIGKKISLGEKDIILRAQKAYPYKPYTNLESKNLRRMGYEQALKDLI